MSGAAPMEDEEDWLTAGTETELAGGAATDATAPAAAQAAAKRPMKKAAGLKPGRSRRMSAELVGLGLPAELVDAKADKLEETLSRAQSDETAKGGGVDEEEDAVPEAPVPREDRRRRMSAELVGLGLPQELVDAKLQATDPGNGSEAGGTTEQGAALVKAASKRRERRMSAENSMRQT
eukprot:SAG22_NODE_173_length_16589_cov_120.738933_15_plen_179_part_00